MPGGMSYVTFTTVFGLIVLTAPQFPISKLNVPLFSSSEPLWVRTHEIKPRSFLPPQIPRVGHAALFGGSGNV